MVGPSLAETDVRQADGTPSKEGSKTRQGNEPVEDNDTSGGQVHVGETTPSEDEDNRPERTTGAVDVGKDLRSVALVSERGESTRTTVDTGDTNRYDGDENDNVHEAIEADETSVLGSNDERRGVGLATLSSEQTLIVVPDEQTDKGKTEDVEKGDTPENLTNSTRKRLEGVLGLSSGKTDQLSSGEGEGGSDEDGAETLEAVVERARVVPSAGTPVLTVDTFAWASTANEDKRDDHEDDSRTELQARRPEFFLGVTQRSEDVDENDEDPENGNEDC